MIRVTQLKITPGPIENTKWCVTWLGWLGIVWQWWSRQLVGCDVSEQCMPMVNEKVRKRRNKGCVEIRIRGDGSTKPEEYVWKQQTCTLRKNPTNLE